jgi:hypothetical protein
MLLTAFSACPTRHGKFLGFDFRGATINSNLHIEIEIRRGSTGDEPRPATERQALNRPLDENQNAILECHDLHEVYEGPHDPGS